MSEQAMITKIPLLFKVLIGFLMTVMACLSLAPVPAGNEYTPNSTIEATAIVESDNLLADSYLVTPVKRASTKISISLITVYKEGTPLGNYATALNSVQCYAKTHSYPFYLFSDAKYEECAKHKDLFFRRHCCIVRFMESSELKPDSWLLVLDGDIAVINPNILIEKFIDDKYDVTLFDRFFNFEVGANSYLVRNTKLGREFVRKFAEYEFRLPKSFHGTDNGALHPYLVEILAPERANLASVCLNIWKKSKNYSNVFEMEVCARLVIGDRTNFPERKLRILPKGKAWLRDLWLLKSRWTEDDFMLHGVKEKVLQTRRARPKNVSDSSLAQWDPNESIKRYFPLLRKLDLDKCELGEEQWLFDSRLKISTEKKTKILDRMEKKILKKRLQTVAKIAKYL